MSDPGDRIELRGMRFLGRHGVTLQERMEPQPIEVDLILWTDLEAAAASDELAETGDYSAAFAQVAGIVQAESYRLIEALAGAILDALMVAQPRVRAAEVRVRKPAAPLPGAFDTVEAVLRRDRPAR
jgi:dihydroneopterin aldolase